MLSFFHHHLPINRGERGNLMNVDKPFQHPLVISGMHCEIKEFPFRS